MAYKTYLKSFKLMSDSADTAFVIGQKMTCYNNIYPFKMFPIKGLYNLSFSPITIFCGSNGSGKSTLLNIIAEKTNLSRHSVFNRSAFFKDYTDGCRYAGVIPENSAVLTGDDVSDYLLNMRALNNGIDIRREELFREYTERKFTSHRFSGMADYENWKRSFDAKSKTKSQFVKEDLNPNIDMYSNGETAMRYYIENIGENALYLLDEPESSLSVSKQIEFKEFLENSARYFGCQFIIATHSPILLSLKDALIYDMDSVPVQTKNWTEIEAIRTYYNFFKAHQSEF